MASHVYGRKIDIQRQFQSFPIQLLVGRCDREGLARQRQSDAGSPSSNISDAALSDVEATGVTE